jgi:hypothetical protein
VNCDPAASAAAIEATIRNTGTEIYRLTNVIPQLIFCILPDKGSELYKTIKMIGDTSLGVITQCMQVAHVKKASVAYIANVIAKVNMKLDGVNQVVEKKDISFVAQAPTMIIGADVSIHIYYFAHHQPFLFLSLICGSSHSSYQFTSNFQDLSPCPRPILQAFGLCSRRIDGRFLHTLRL